MISADEILTRNKITGVLVRSARLEAGKSVEECAEALGRDPEWYTRAEEGAEGLTLPQLESLSHLLDVPLSALLDGEMSPIQEDAAQTRPYHEVMRLRRKIIGVILRRARLESGRTLDDIAPTLGLTPERLARVELGEEPLSLVELDALAETLGVSFDVFVADDVAPLTPAERAKRDLRRLQDLPPDLREFVLQPINIPYLQVAKNLSQMPSETLRQIATGLLEITY